MYTVEEKNKFVEVAESLKKYRRAELIDEDGKSILDKLYVDLLPQNIILNKCMLDNTTFLIGRRGTGKSTIFLKLENEYRNKKTFLPCYIDVKTIYESSQAQAINKQYLQDYFNGTKLNEYLMARNFIQSVLKRIYEEIDLQRKNIFEKIRDTISGNSNEEIKEKILKLNEQIDDNKIFKSIEIPVLQQKVCKESNLKKAAEAVKQESYFQNSLSMNAISIEGKVDGMCSNSQESANNKEEEYTDILLKVFQIKNVIEEIRKILKKLGINKLIIMLDDISEIDEEAIRIFIDTIVAPLNNWSEEFIKFKIAFYPGRIHYGMIDPGKIDIVKLDFYDLYSEFDSSKMEENAIDFTKRLLENRFDYYKLDINKFFSKKNKLEDVYKLFFRTSMNVPRIVGFLLSYMYQSTIIYDEKISTQDIENASARYYDDCIDAFFSKSTYCLLPMEEKRDISQLKKIRDMILLRSKEIKSQILRGELTGKIYDKSRPYSSHFHIIQEMDNYLESLELNHFISKYEERANRDGKMTNIYCINYGLAVKNNIYWGKNNGSEYRTYFIERPFNYTNLVLDQVKVVREIKCSGCGRIYSEEDRKGLEFTGYTCPTCHAKVEETSKIDKEVDENIQTINELPLLSKDEMLILIELRVRKSYVQAKTFSGDVDINSYRIAKICKKMDEDKGVVDRKMDVQPYAYKISMRGSKYFS